MGRVLRPVTTHPGKKYSSSPPPPAPLPPPPQEPFPIGLHISFRFASLSMHVCYQIHDYGNCWQTFLLHWTTCLRMRNSHIHITQYSSLLWQEVCSILVSHFHKYFLTSIRANSHYQQFKTDYFTQRSQIKMAMYNVFNTFNIMYLMVSI